MKTDYLKSLRTALALGLVCVLVLVSCAARAQVGGGQDQQVATSSSPVVRGNVTCVAVDSSGNRYIAGSFAELNADFNPGANQDFKTAAGGSQDVFVTRYNADGSYGWTQTFGGTSQDVANRILVANGKVYVVGFFSGTDSGINGAANIASVGSTDAFVFALNAADGSAVSGFGNGGVVKFGGSGADAAEGVAFNGTTLFVAGHFQGSNAGINGPGTYASSGQSDAFVMALNPGTGLPVSGFGVNGVKKFGGTGDDNAFAIAATASVLFVAGSFTSSDAGIGGPGSLASSGGADAFVICLSATDGSAFMPFNGNGMVKFGGGFNDTATGITLAAGNVYVTGIMDAGVAGTPSAAFVLAMISGTGAPVSAFGTTGFQRFGGSAGDEGVDIASNGSTLFVTGNLFSNNAGIFGPGTAKSQGMGDIFVLGLNSTDGKARTGFGNNGVQVYGGKFNETAKGVAVSNDGTKVFVVGSADSTDAGINGTGKFKHDIFHGVMLPLDSSSGAPAFGMITSPLAVAASHVGFSYAITSSPTATTYDAQNLPSGLSISASTGMITRNASLPAPVGTFEITIAATTSLGTTSALLTLTLLDDAVANTSPPVVQGTVAGVAVDTVGNKYVCGTYIATVDFNPFVGADVKLNRGANDCYITRYNADGSYAWTQTFGGSGDDSAAAIVELSGKIYVTGTFNSTDAGFGGQSGYAPVGGFDIFVLALDAATGTPVPNFGNGGVVRFGGDSFDSASSLAVSNGVLFVGGSFSSSNGGFNGPGTVASTGDGGSGVILAINAADGSPVSGFGNGGAQTFGGSSMEAVQAVFATTGAVYVTGILRSTNAGIGGLGSYASVGGADAFLLKLSPTTGQGDPAFGAVGFVRFGAPAGEEIGTSVTVSGSTVYVTGNQTVSGSTDVFVAAYNTADGSIVTSFGSGGTQTFGGTGDDFARSIVAFGSDVYVTGNFSSSNATIGGGGATFSSSSIDAYVMALNAADGKADVGFGNSGLVKVSGSGVDLGAALVAAGGSLFLGGSSDSTDATVNASSQFSSTNFGGFLIQMSPATGEARPMITSPLTGGGVSGAAFSYSITATNFPTAFNATLGQTGLNLNGNVISGNLPAAGNYSITLSAANNFGTGAAVVLQLMVVAPPAPVINSLLALTVPVNVQFNYTITATNNPTSWSTGALPQGLALTPRSNLISGIPTVIGNYMFTISASNSGGTDTKTVSLAVVPPAPAINSPLTATGTVGVPFSYTITATNVPTQFGALNLPSSLLIDANSGVISGTPTVAETRTLTIGATNAGGSDSKQLVITINPAKPVINSPLTATATVGVPFSYTVTATNSPTSFTAIVLPPNFSFNSSTGVLSGTPSAPEIRTLTLTATNAGGTDSKTLILTINPAIPAPAISSVLIAAGTLNVDFLYTITASNSPTSFGSSTLPGGLTLDKTTGVISGKPTLVGTFKLSITATNAGGTDTKVLALAISDTPVTGPLVSMDLTSSDPTYFINQPVTFTLTGFSLVDTPLTYTLDFGDGSALLKGSTSRNIPLSFTHPYASPGAYTVTGTMTDGSINASLKLTQTILSPNSGADGVVNISEGKPPVENPLNGLMISVVSSDGGIVQLAIDINSLIRANFEASTEWGDIPGRSTTTLGLRPVHQYIKHGIFVAKTSAIQVSDGTVVGIGRKMITVSSQETGETTPKKFPVIEDRRTRAEISNSISVTSMKGKFIFSGSKSDTVVFAGTITLPAGIDPGKTHEFSMGIGNIIVNASVDGKGNGTSSDKPKVFQKLKLTYVKLKKGQVSKGGEICKVEATLLSTGLVAAGFDTEGISKSATDATPGSKTAASRSIQVAMLFDGVPFEGSAGVDFTVSKDSEFGNILSRSSK